MTQKGALSEQEIHTAIEQSFAEAGARVLTFVRERPSLGAVLTVPSLDGADEVAVASWMHEAMSTTERLDFADATRRLPVRWLDVRKAYVALLATVDGDPWALVPEINAHGEHFE